MPKNTAPKKSVSAKDTGKSKAKTDEVVAASKEKSKENPRSPESKDTPEVHTKTGKDIAVSKEIDHRDFRPSENKNIRFMFSDYKIEPNDTYIYRRYTDEFIRYAIGLDDSLIENHRLEVIAHSFSELLINGFNFIPRRFINILIDQSLWTYVFRIYLKNGEDFPRFPFEVPPRDLQAQRCPAYAVWRVYLGLTVNDSEEKSPQVIAATGKPAIFDQDFSIEKLKHILDSTGHKGYYIPRSARGKVLDLDDREELENVSSEPAKTFDTSVKSLADSSWAEELSDDLQQKSNLKEEEEDFTNNNTSLVNAWSKLGFFPFWRVGFVNRIFSVWIPNRVARMEVVNTTNKNSIALESPLEENKFCLLYKQENKQLLSISLAVCKGSGPAEKNDFPSLTNIWRMLFIWARAVWQGVPVPLASWNRVWVKSLYPLMKGDDELVIIRMSAFIASEYAKKFTKEHIDMLVESRASATKTWDQWLNALKVSDKAKPELVLEILKKDTRGDPTSSLSPRSYDRYMHFCILAVNFVQVEGTQFWGDEASDMALQLGRELTQMALESQ